jgi:SAM-dependent methyltransferase
MSDANPATHATSPPDEATLAGQAIYSRRLLKWYDFIVLTVSNRWIWRCPTPVLLDWYNSHVSANHLDIGVGSGYFLDRCRFPVADPRITLLDLNPNCLEVAAARIRRYQPAMVIADVLQPLDVARAPFSSIGVNYVLHCLPGDLTRKTRLFDHVTPLLSPDGVLFGSTLLGQGVARGWPARRLAAFYNERRVFSNADDSLQDLRQALQARFEQVRIETRGCVALFAANGVRRTSS